MSTWKERESARKGEEATAILAGLYRLSVEPVKHFAESINYIENKLGNTSDKEYDAIDKTINYQSSSPPILSDKDREYVNRSADKNEFTTNVIGVLGGAFSGAAFSGMSKTGGLLSHAHNAAANRAMIGAGGSILSDIGDIGRDKIIHEERHPEMSNDAIIRVLDKKSNGMLLGSKINELTNMPYEHKNDPKVNLGYELTASPANLGGGLIDHEKDNKRIQDILAKAKDEYKFIPKNMQAVANRKDVDKYGHLESYAAGEQGTLEYPRPTSLPLDVHGLEVYNIDGVHQRDIAGDKMHTDGIANDTRHVLNNSLSGSQLDTLYKTSKDYQYSID